MDAERLVKSLGQLDPQTVLAVLRHNEQARDRSQ
jgi:hypothetical protein